MKNQDFLTSDDFSIILGGPFFQLLRKAGLADSTFQLLKKRIIIISMFAWFPLLLLSVISGKAWNGNLEIPFLYDIEIHFRFLIAVPLMVLAELLVHQQMRTVVNEFLKRKMIPDNSLDRFNKAIRSAIKMRNSYIAEALILAIVFGVGVLVIWPKVTSIDTTTWYATPTTDGRILSAAGIRFGYVSMPIFHFLLLRWYYRIFIWSRFLFQVSKIKLQLFPTHPDYLGGLRFFVSITKAFTPLAMAHGVVLSGYIANRILHKGNVLLDFKFEIIIIVALIICLVQLPFLFFVGQLTDIKRIGVREYGALATRYVREFDKKWNQDKTPSGEEFIGSSDIQSLADFGHSYDIVLNMQVVPVTKETFITLTTATIAPLIPLLLTMMPLSELLQNLAGILL